jgi:hypothetical protein
LPAPTTLRALASSRSNLGYAVTRLVATTAALGDEAAHLDFLPLLAPSTLLRHIKPKLAMFVAIRRASSVPVRPENRHHEAGGLFFDGRRSTVGGKRRGGITSHSRASPKNHSPNIRRGSCFGIS